MNVLLTRDGPIATVTLNRPDRRNSLSDEMLTDLGAAFAELRDDASTRVVIVTGAPPVFSAGADAAHAKAATQEERVCFDLLSVLVNQVGHRRHICGIARELQAAQVPGALNG